jgi:hypothetical protein
VPVHVTKPRARRAAAAPGPWAITVAATAVSTYALDAVATVAGVALVATGLLAGLGHGLLAGALALTYVAWAAGMRVNLRANWELLEATGTSTNALSKAAHAIARRRGMSAAAQRLASSGGYVVTELAKELPYYAAAFGAVMASGSLGTNDALIFLAGTNLGAGIYEYGLARLTRVFLQARRHGVARSA